MEVELEEEGQEEREKVIDRGISPFARQWEKINLGHFMRWCRLFRVEFSSPSFLYIRLECWDYDRINKNTSFHVLPILEVERARQGKWSKARCFPSAQLILRLALRSANLRQCKNGGKAKATTVELFFTS